jgi:cell shape-determining protein MreC
MLALPLLALAMVFLPPSITDRVRVWAGPVFAPLQNVTEDWSLDLADRLRHGDASAPDAETQREDRVASLQNALAQAAAVLGEYDRQVRDLAKIRDGLDGFPCRVIPARLLSPEVPGGHAGARLGEGADKGIRRNAAVVAGQIDRGGREALQRGEPILTAAGLVGIVDEVGPLTSTVRLITDPRATMMVQVITHRNGQWRAGPEGMARGTADGTAVLVTGIQRTSDVAPGDFVVTSPPRESNLPSYLIVGRVVRCNQKPAAVFIDLLVEPRVRLSDARQVYVLSPDFLVAPRK